MPREYKLLIAWVVLAVLMSLGVLLVAAWTETDVSAGEAMVGGMVGSAVVLWMLLSGRS